MAFSQKSEMSWRCGRVLSCLSRAAEAAVRSIEAGADIVLMPLHYQQAFDGVVRAVEEGRLTEERIDASVARVQTLRERKKHLQSI